MKCLRIDSTVDAQVKYDIFERLNTGSVKLEAQELRNATARGPFNDAAKDLAALPSFRHLIQVDPKQPDLSVKVQKMEDAELVLRFFALKSGGYKALKKGFKEFLTSSLHDFNELSPEQITYKRSEFEVYMDFLYHHIGSSAFSKFRMGSDGSLRRMSSFNAAVFDAVAVGLAESFTAEQVSERPDEIAGKMNGYQEALFPDPDFFAAVSGSVNDAAKVTKRIDLMVEFLNR